MRRIFFAAFVISWIILSSISFGATYGGGSGTAENPYQIWTPQQMNTIGANPSDWGKCFKLMADIDMSAYMGTQYKIIGTGYFNWFTGIFDGNNHKIRNLSYATTAAVSYVGLFGYTYNASIKNLGIENINISTQGDPTGGLVGYQAYGSITNCYSTGLVISSAGFLFSSGPGGLVGCLDRGNVVNCYSTVTVAASASRSTSPVYAGGLVGRSAGTIDKCWSTGMVNATNTATSSLSGAGGLIGVQVSGTISNCGRTGPLNVSSSSEVGGLVGNQEDGVIINCYNIGTITASPVSTHAEVGGIVGCQEGGTITNCFNLASVTSAPVSSFSARSGGLVGHQSSGAIDYSYNTGSIRAITIGTSHDSFAGGLVGEQYSGNNSNCYNTGSIYASSNSDAFLGGLVGVAISGSLTKSYSTGPVTVTATYVVKGGVVGHCSGVTINSCFWDTQTSGITDGVGDLYPDPSGVQGKTTVQMKTQSTFTSAGWDFANTWYMTGYPSLKWEINPLQSQIDAALNGDIIVVQPGLYQGRLYFKGKNITLTSINPQNPNIVASTIIQGLSSGSVITFTGTETSDCVLSGFTITGGYSAIYGGGVIGNDCAATIQNCHFHGNTAATAAGGAIWGVHGPIEKCIINNNTAPFGGGIAKSNGTVRNCLIYGNQSPNATGLNNCDGTIQNCTIVSDKTSSLVRNCDGIIKDCILYSPGTVFDTCTAVISYSCWSGATGTGNISTDPMFINLVNNDYHLMPDSPCIDAGDPASDYSNEALPNGGRVNMGAYGNTPEATTSRNGLIPMGFVIVNKTRLGRTSFEYELAVTVHNSNSFDMTDVQMQLMDWDVAVQSVSDDSITIDSIPSGITVTSTDTFKIIVDRSQLIVSSRLTWVLTYYTSASGDQVQQAMMSMLLSGIDAISGSDITGNGRVNLEDFAILAQQWNTVPGTPSADIALPLDGYVGIEDLMYLAENWMN